MATVVQEVRQAYEKIVNDTPTLEQTLPRIVHGMIFPPGVPIPSPRVLRSMEQQAQKTLKRIRTRGPIVGTDAVPASRKGKLLYPIHKNGTVILEEPEARNYTD